MGCDIHGFIEVKQNNTWKSVEDLSDISRNYSFFAFMFGVRNYEGFEPFFPYRGFPEDSDPVQTASFKRWEYDAHSPSYFSYDEFKNIDTSRTNNVKKDWPYGCRGDGGEIETVTVAQVIKESCYSFGVLSEKLEKVKKEYPGLEIRAVVYFDS